MTLSLIQEQPDALPCGDGIRLVRVKPPQCLRPLYRAAVELTVWRALDGIELLARARRDDAVLVQATARGEVCFLAAFPDDRVYRVGSGTRGLIAWAGRTFACCVWAKVDCDVHRAEPFADQARRGLMEVPYTQVEGAWRHAVRLKVTPL